MGGWGAGEWEKCRGRGGGRWKTEEGIHTECSRRRLCRENVRDDVHFDLSLSATPVSLSRPLSSRVHLSAFHLDRRHRLGHRHPPDVRQPDPHSAVDTVTLLTLSVREINSLGLQV